MPCSATSQTKHLKKKETKKKRFTLRKRHLGSFLEPKNRNGA